MVSGGLKKTTQKTTNLFQNTLSSNPSWPLEIFRNAEENNGHLNNPPRQLMKKHCGKYSRIRNRQRIRAHSPTLPRILLVNVQSLENKMDKFPMGHNGL